MTWFGHTCWKYLGFNISSLWGKTLRIFHFFLFPSIVHPHLQFRFCFTLYLPASSVHNFFFKWEVMGDREIAPGSIFCDPQVLYTCRYIAQQNVPFSTEPVQQQKLIYPLENSHRALQPAISSTTLGTFSSHSGLGSDTCPHLFNMALINMLSY